MNCGGIILCGGRSRRMGSDKAWLPFGSETMLQRVVRICGEAVRPLVVVAAAGARLPELRPDVIVVHDRRPERGPLEGLAVGLSALAQVEQPASDAGRTTAAYVTSCDVPFLLPAFIRRMIGLLDASDYASDYAHPGFARAEIAAPKIDGRLHPLAAVYRLSVLPDLERRLAANQLRLTDLVEQLHARIVVERELRDVDPELQSLRNVNDLQEYRAAIEARGGTV